MSDDEVPKENGTEDLEMGEKDACLEEGADSPLPTKDKKASPLDKGATAVGVTRKIFVVLLILFILVLLFFIIVIALAASWPATNSAPPQDICHSQHCLQAAAQIKSMMNSSNDPCTDFWQFSCGDWLDKNRIPRTHSRWGIIPELQAKVLGELRSIINTLPNPSDVRTVEWKVKYFYDSCMALDYVNGDSDKQLKRTIVNLGGWHVLRNFQRQSWDYRLVLQKLHADFGVNPLFRIEVSTDENDPTKNVIRISPDGFGLPDRSYYYRHPEDEVNVAYKHFLRDVVQLLGATGPQASQFAEEMFHYEKRLAEITPEVSVTPPGSDVTVTMATLRSISFSVPWLDILKATYPDLSLDDDTNIKISSVDYVKDVSTLISTSDRETLNNYMMWRLTSSFLPYLPEDYRRVEELYRKEMTGAEESAPRWEMCARTTNKFFGLALSSLYSNKMTKDEQAQQENTVAEIFERLQQNMGDSISNTRALGKKEKSILLSRMSAMKLQVGVPPVLLQKSVLNSFYSDFSVLKNDFFQNVVNGAYFRRRVEERQFQVPGDQTELEGPLTRYSVTYLPAINTVVVPPYLLIQPIFDPQYPSAVLYGGFGTFLSLAMSEAIGERGLSYSVNGTIRVVSRRVQEAFEDQKQCLARKYELRLLEKPEAINRTIDKSVAEITAVHQVVTAFKDLSSDVRQGVLPSMEQRNTLQILFLTYGQSLCSVSTVQQQDIDRTVGRRLPKKARLLGTVSQLDSFRKAFGCSQYSSCKRVL